jgi:nitrate/nitrite-specific signal transduction histidine kinase
LTITDDGCGMPADPEKSRGMGLGIMQYRARLIGAVLSVEPRPEGGTVIRCSFPQTS